MSMENCSDTIGNRTRDLQACSAVPQSTASPGVPIVFVVVYIVCYQLNLFVLSICSLLVCSYLLYQSVRLYPHISILQQYIFITVNTAQNCNSPYLIVTNLHITDRTALQQPIQLLHAAVRQAAHTAITHLTVLSHQLALAPVR
jgi:hypothetical protein